MRNQSKVRWVVGVSALALSLPGVSMAQARDDRPASVVDEFVVTAQKREESLLDVPISITYVGDEQLSRQNITTNNDLARAVPGLGPSSFLSGFSIRGIATQGNSASVERSVGTAVDGVPGGTVGPYFDVDHVEVLMGPQGTLFGKNSSGGIISITTRAPQLGRYETIAHADVGTFDYKNLSLVTNVPIGENLAVRLGGVHTGYGHILYNPIVGKWDTNSATALRAKIRWEPTDNLSVNLISTYARSDANGVLSQGTYPGTASTFRYIETVAGTPAQNAANLALIQQLQASCGAPAAAEDLFISCSESNGVGDKRQNTRQTWANTLQIDYQLGDYTLTSISHARNTKYGNFATQHLYQNDVDIRPSDFLSKSMIPSTGRDQSQEIRLASPTGRRLEYVLGVYYENNHVLSKFDQAGGLGAGLPDFIKLRRVHHITVDGWNIGVFGQFTYNLRDDLRLIAGGRFTHDSLKVVGIADKNVACPAPLLCISTPSFDIWEVDRKVKNDDFSWRLGAEYDVLPSVMLYATVTRGYKAGFVNEVLTPYTVGGALAPNPFTGVLGEPLAPVYVEPEIPYNYELGAKGTALDGRLGFTTAIYYTKVKDFQASIAIPSTSGGSVPSFGFGNAPFVESKGVEFNAFGKPIRGLTLSGGFAYIKANYSKDFVVTCSPTYVIDPIPGCIPFPTNPNGGSKVVNGQLGGVPKWRFVASGEYERPISDEIGAFVQADLQHRTSVTSLVGDPLYDLGSETTLGARIGIRRLDGGWSLAIFGRNLQQSGKRDAGFATRDFAAPGTVLTNGWSLDSVKVLGVTLDGRF